MRAPRLTRELVLETRERTADGAGGFADGWRALGRLWAEVMPRTGRDRAGEGARLGVVPSRIVVRAAPVGDEMRPKPGQRFREGARLFRIEAVAEYDARARFLTCFAEEEVAA